MSYSVYNKNKKIKNINSLQKVQLKGNTVQNYATRYTFIALRYVCMRFILLHLNFTLIQTPVFKF